MWQGAVGAEPPVHSPPSPGPAFHHHTWETNTLQLNPQDSIQGMLPESAWPRSWLSVLGACHTLEGAQGCQPGAK